MPRRREIWAPIATRQKPVKKPQCRLFSLSDTSDSRAARVTARQSTNQSRPFIARIPQTYR